MLIKSHRFEGTHRSRAIERRFIPSVELPNGRYERCTHVIVDVLTTNMEQRIREVVVGHLETVVEDPKRSTITLRNTRETTARTRVGLKHDEWQPSLLSKPGGFAVVPHEFDHGLVSQEGVEVLLRIVVSTDTESCETIVVRVPSKPKQVRTSQRIGKYTKPPHLSTVRANRRSLKWSMKPVSHTSSGVHSG